MEGLWMDVQPACQLTPLLSVTCSIQKNINILPVNIYYFYWIITTINICAQTIVLLRPRVGDGPAGDAGIVVAGDVVEGPEVGSADGVVFQHLSVVKITIIRDIRIAECKAERIIVGTLQDSAS